MPQPTSAAPSPMGFNPSRPASSGIQRLFEEALRVAPIAPAACSPQEGHLPPAAKHATAQDFPFPHSFHNRTRADSLYQHPPIWSLCPLQTSCFLLCSQRTGVSSTRTSPACTSRPAAMAPRPSRAQGQDPAHPRRHTPCYEVPADIQEDEEALLVRCVGPMRAEGSFHLLHCLQVEHVQINLLGDGGWLHRVGDDAVPRPGAAVHVQVPWGGEQRGYPAPHHMRRSSQSPSCKRAAQSDRAGTERFLWSLASLHLSSLKSRLKHGNTLLKHFLPRLERKGPPQLGRWALGAESSLFNPVKTNFKDGDVLICLGNKTDWCGQPLHSYKAPCLTLS